MSMMKERINDAGLQCSHDRLIAQEKKRQQATRSCNVKVEGMGVQEICTRFVVLR